MKWNNIKDLTPIAYKTGNWDGKCSDKVLVIDTDGEYHIAEYCEGILDGSKFKDWYDERGFEIDYKVERWAYLESN